MRGNCQSTPRGPESLWGGCARAVGLAIVGFLSYSNSGRMARNEHSRAMADAGKKRGGAPLPELTFVSTWRERINREIESQVSYAKEWGSLESESSRLPPTLEEQIEAKRAELEALKSHVGEPPMYMSVSMAQQVGKDGHLERFEPVDSELDQSLRAVAGTHTRRGHS
jgi:hypothetical protein